MLWGSRGDYRSFWRWGDFAMLSRGMIRIS
jgi:hypothetical protein